MKVSVLSGDGDAPGINAAIRVLLGGESKLMARNPRGVLDHLQWGGASTAFDRILATRSGVAAYSSASSGFRSPESSQASEAAHPKTFGFYMILLGLCL
jgi:6-phosphofructokinase